METPFVLDSQKFVPPTPHQLDAMVETFEDIRDRAELADELYEDAKRELIELIQQFGTVPAGAESSLRLQGQRTFITVTTGTTIAIKEDAVVTLEGAMEANDHAGLFDSMFGTRTKHELLKGAENTLRTAKLPKRLVKKYTELYARCFDVKKKSPSLKVERIDAAKPAKKGGR
jgi:hypothetical protein